MIANRRSRAIANCATGLSWVLVSAAGAGLAGQEAGGLSALSGLWRGDLVTPAGALTLVLTLDGGETGTIGVPDRGVSGIPVTDVTLSAEGSVTFAVPADAASFEGRLESAERLEGAWIQAGQRIEIAFERVGDADEAVPARPRPQTPRPPFPYDVEEITVAGGEQLACELTSPRDAERPVPGVVLLTVAGPNDRDQTHSGHKPFLVLADHLTRRGIAVLRCDDRGVGGSSGSLPESTMDDLVGDARALVRTLRARPEVGPVGVIGNSEGSVVGSIVAAAAPDEVAFAVLLGGVGVTGAAVIRARLVARELAAGATEDEAQALVAPFDSLTRVVTEAGGIGAAELEASRPDLYERLVEIARVAGASDPFLPRDLDERVALLAGPWYHAQLTLDGAAVLERVRAPVLALTGSKDRVNLPEQNLPTIREALARGGNPDYRVVEVPDLNHVFQTAEVGGMAEYPRLEETFSPVALEIIADWILERDGQDRPGSGGGAGG